MKTINATMANDHGRRMGLRSPLLARNGRSIRAAINRAGPRMITQSSDHFGIKVSTAKYHKKYHSGRGEAATMVGSGGFPSSGGPTITASATTATGMRRRHRARRHPAKTALRPEPAMRDTMRDRFSDPPGGQPRVVLRFRYAVRDTDGI